MFDLSGSGRSPGGRNGNSLQYSCLENPMHRGAWQATVHGFARVRHDLATKRPPCTQQQRHSTAKNKEINKNRGIKKFFNLKDAMEAQAPTTPLSYMTLCTLPCVCWTYMLTNFCLRSSCESGFCGSNSQGPSHWIEDGSRFDPWSGN